MTYRLDSDIPYPYGWVSAPSPLFQYYPPPGGSPAWSPLPPVTPDMVDKFGKDRPKLVAWLVSNCHTHSNREDYVGEMSKYVTVDVFGLCGSQADISYHGLN